MIWASEKIKRKIRFQNQNGSPPFFFSAPPQFFPSLSPSQEGSFFSLYERGGRGRERDAGTTENASVTDDSEQSSDDE